MSLIVLVMLLKNYKRVLGVYNMDIYVLEDNLLMAVFNDCFNFNSVIEEYLFYNGLIERIKKVVRKSEIDVVDIVVGNVVEVFFRF